MVSKLGEMVLEFRGQRGYSQRHLASILGVSYTYISKIENGTTDYPPSQELLEKLAVLMDVNRDWLIFQSGRVPESCLDIVAALADRYGDRLPGKLLELLDDWHKQNN